MKEIYVSDISDSFYAKIAEKDVSIKQARNMGIRKLIETNTDTESIYIKNCQIEDFNELLAGLKTNTTLTKLMVNHLNRKNPDSRISKLEKSMVLLMISDYVYVDDLIRLFEKGIHIHNLLIKIIYNDLTAPYLPNFTNLIQTMNVTRVDISIVIYDIEIEILKSISHIFNNPHIISLSINQWILEQLILHTQINYLQTNTKLETLKVKKTSDHIDNIKRLSCVIKNISEINTSIVKVVLYSTNTHSRDELSYVPYLERNRQLRWNYIHGVLMNVIIAFASYRIRDDLIPPYVLSEIFDWIYPDNPYTTHLKKINLIMKMYQTIRCIKPCLNPTTLEIIEK